MSHLSWRGACRWSVVLLCLGGAAQARVIRLEVENRESAQGYSVLSGHFFGELDPGDPRNLRINDLELAPRNAAGRVEYAATFRIKLPSDPLAVSGVLLYEVPNRGHSPLDFEPFADDVRANHVLVSSGWQGDLEPNAGLQTITVPIARIRDGSPITGPVLARFMNQPAGASTASLQSGYAGLHYQRPASLDTTKATLTKQASDDGEMVPVPASQWAFADCKETPFPGKPDPTSICLQGGFAPNLLYQMVYQAKDPLVLGIGLAATRDLISFLRYATEDDRGNRNPVAGRIRHAIAFGTSQSGNFLKTFLNLGFNEDEQKRIVCDGINPNIAGRQTPLNFRFAIPGGAASLSEPGSEGVLWWSDARDDLRNRSPAGLLDRCRSTHTCPKIMETFGSTEFWGLRMSPGLVGTSAEKDIPLPPEVRRYYFPGVTHGGGKGGFSGAVKPVSGCELLSNPNSSAESMRALRKALIAWVVRNEQPPESRYPRLDRGELVAPQSGAMGFPTIPGKPQPDNLMNRFWIYDFGPAFRSNDLSGSIALQPPVVRGMVPMLVPRTDADGNEVSGVASVLHRAPLGTYTGWNVADSGYLKGHSCGFVGGFIPFAKTKAERMAVSDPRASLEERYGTHAGYAERVKAAAEELRKEKFLLPDDAARLIREAEASDVLR